MTKTLVFFTKLLQIVLISRKIISFTVQLLAKDTLGIRFIMMTSYDLTSYNYYSNRNDMELISTIVDSLKKILEEDKKQIQPLFLRISDNLIMNIARMVVQEKKKTFLIGITGESAYGKTVFVDNITGCEMTFPDCPLKNHCGEKKRSTTHTSKLFSSNRKSSIPIYAIPLSSVNGIMCSLTITIFLNESAILTSGWISCLCFSGSSILNADCT